MNPTNSMLRQRVLPIFGAAVLAFSSMNAIAQTGADLPRSTVETISVSPAQRDQITQFVDAWAPKIQSDDPQGTKRAIEALTKPLASRGVSIAFRQAYTQTVSGLLDRLEADQSVSAKLSALRLAGDLATPEAVDIIISGIQDDDLGVSLFAVSRAGRALEVTQTLGPAITGSDARKLIQSVLDLSNTPEADPELVRAAARTLAAGSALTNKDLADTRSQAIIALSDLVGSRLHQLSANDDPGFAQELSIDAASSITRAVSDITAEITPQAARAAVRLGGDIISVPLRRVVAKTIEPVAERQLTISSVQSGETLLYFARKKAAELDGQSISDIQTTKLAAQLTAGEDRQFRNDAAALLGPGATIVRAFNFADDRFLF